MEDRSRARLDAMPSFIPGRELSARFYAEAVRPILDASFPNLPHAAALIGSGSEVLGFDTPVSADHHWGPRAMLFLDERDHVTHAEAIRETLRHRLPHRFLDWPTNFAAPTPEDPGTQLLAPTSEGPVDHRVEVLTVAGFFRDYLGYDLTEPPTPADWLTFPSQKLRTIAGGSIFHDAIGLGETCARFSWYPHDVWLYLLASGWNRISQEEHLMGRAGQVGDELGSSIIAARLVRDLMRLSFLMERQHAPYPKWFGTGFARLEIAAVLTPLFHRVLRAETWPERDHALGEGYEVVARRHNALGVTKPLISTSKPFPDWHARPDRPVSVFTSAEGRPFRTIFAGRFVSALRELITDPAVRDIPVDIGSIDQWSDSTDMVEQVQLRQRLEALYERRSAATAGAK
jgi:hypothetical protein